MDAGGAAPAFVLFMVDGDIDALKTINKLHLAPAIYFYLILNTGLVHERDSVRFKTTTRNI